MYLISRTTDKAEMEKHGFDAAEAERAADMELLGTSFSDPGPDYCEFRLRDGDGRVLATRRVDGY